MFAAFCTGFKNLLLINTDKDIIPAAAKQMQALEERNLSPWLLIILMVVIVGIALYAFKIHHHFPKWWSKISSKYKGFISKIKSSKGTGSISFDGVIEAAGYGYDENQDVFYSVLDPWQRSMGYCRLYDEAAAPLNMIIDCEPIYFEYDGRRWMIEFWKGQYALTAGCEIGVYNTTRPDLNIPGIFNGPFFDCASNEDLLKMSYTLKKNDKVLFKRDDKHWWLTGFKLGEFAEPWELTMDLSVTLKDEEMCRAFIEGLKKAGYLDKEINRRGNTVSLIFDETKTRQPTTRRKETDWLIQRKNEVICRKYQHITREYDTFPEKIKAIQQQAPEIYEAMKNLGKPRLLFRMFRILKKYLD
jgi:hypothetical protein